MAQARLDVKVTGDASGALRAINAVRAAGDEFANKFREQSKEAVGQIVHMINPVILLSTAIVAGVAKGVDAIRKHFEQGREMARKANEDLQKNAKDLGVTADAYQAVRTQAQMAGKSVDEFNAAMKSVKEGKATIDEVAASFRMIGSGAQAAREAAKQIALEVAGERMAREKAAEEAEKNRSAVTRADRLEAWGRARIAQGASMDEVRNGIIDSDRSAWAWQRLSYRERQEMFARLEAYHTQNSPEAVATRAQAAQAAREQAASEAAWAQAEQEARARVQAINAAGGVLNWAVGQVSAQAGGLVGADDSRVQELVSRYSRWYERSRLALSGNPAAEYAKQSRPSARPRRRPRPTRTRPTRPPRPSKGALPT